MTLSRFALSRSLLATTVAALMAGCVLDDKLTAPGEGNAATRIAANPAPRPDIDAYTDITLIQFDKLRARLTPETETQLSALLPALKVSRQITLRGFCNRREVGNCDDAARVRAESVRDFIVKGGIPADKIKITTDTERPLHAVRVSFFSP